MKHLFVTLLTLAYRIALAQTPATREQMQLPDRLSKEQLAAGYQTNANGWVVQKGDNLLLVRGSLPDKRFAFIYESLTSLTATSSLNGGINRVYLNSAMAGQRALVKELFQYGTKRSGYTMIAKVGVGNITNYWIELDNAIEAGELLPPAPYQAAPANPTPSKGSVADEIKKLKELLDWRFR